MAISTMFHLKITISKLGKTQRCPQILSTAPPPINIVREGKGEGALSPASCLMPLHRVESCALATMLLQRASGRKRKREEGIALSDGGHPGSFINKRKVDALLRHLGYRLWLWTLTFGYLLCPLCLKEGFIVHGGSLLPPPSHTVGIFFAPPLLMMRCPHRHSALCACPMLRYWLELYYQEGSSSGSTIGGTAHLFPPFSFILARRSCVLFWFWWESPESGTPKNRQTPNKKSPFFAKMILTPSSSSQFYD